MNRLKNPKYWLALPVILLSYGLAKWGGQSPTQQLLHLALLCGGYAASLTDLLERRVPNRLTAALALAWPLLLSPLALYDTAQAALIALNGLVGLVIAAVVMLAVYFVSRKGLGGGDVKLMCAAGLYLGYDGALTALLYGSVLAAVTALALIVAKKISVKDAIPLVPFLYAGMLLTEFIR